MNHPQRIGRPSLGLRTLLALLAFALFLPAAASAAGPRQRARKGKVNARQAKQERRIEQGKRSGELTRPEARKLERQQKRIQRAEHRAKADGKVTRREARKLDRMQDKANRDIRRAKNNRPKRPRAR
ncbi:MAG: hypothetical protein RIT45_2695 [Pseudomonadota bacterium]|jgi:uncharacterized protein HemX